MRVRFGKEVEDNILIQPAFLRSALNVYFNFSFYFPFFLTIFLAANLHIPGRRNFIPFGIETYFPRFYFEVGAQNLKKFPSYQYDMDLYYKISSSLLIYEAFFVSTFFVFIIYSWIRGSIKPSTWTPKKRNLVLSLAGCFIFPFVCPLHTYVYSPIRTNEGILFVGLCSNAFFVAFSSFITIASAWHLVNILSRKRSS